MKNAVGRDIPEEVMEETGKDVFRGTYYYNENEYRTAPVKKRFRIGGSGTKLINSIQEALISCNAHDGMTISFHHHFREGDLVAMQVMNAIH